MKKAVQFGAGNIGRGFIGYLLSNSGYHVVFADINKDIINKINSDKSYKIKIMDVECSEEIVTNISAVDSTSDVLFEELKTSEIITTSVGLTILPKIASSIANTISYHFNNNTKKYINIIACENAINASSQLKQEVYKFLNELEKEYADNYIGFPNCSVDRIVPPVKSDNIIDVVVENYYEWNVEKYAFKGDIPEIKGINLVDDLMPYIERKLFTLNTGHAITAYLGYLKKIDTIDLSIDNQKIYSIVKNAMLESGNALIKKYNFDKESHINYIDKIIGRFKNPYLKDDVIRVGREPIRKLGSDDRLIKPLKTALNHINYIDKIIGRFKNPYLKDDVIRVGREPIRKLGSDDRLIKPLKTALNFDLPVENLMIGVVAALNYYNYDDIQSVKLKESIRDIGVIDTLKNISGISDDKLLYKLNDLYCNIKDII